MNGIVELDVGGKVFKTNITTLTLSSGYFNSMFGTWRESRSLEPVFLDRDSGTFEIILKFLRTGKLYIDPQNTLLLKELADEAEYFQIPDLVNAVQEKLLLPHYECRTVYDVCLHKFVEEGWEIVRESKVGNGLDPVFVGSEHCEVCREVVYLGDNLTAHGMHAYRCFTIRRVNRP